MDDTLANELRPKFPVLAGTTYLNTGTVGLMSESVLAPHLNRIAEYERLGHLGEAEAREGFERARSGVASLIGARPSQIALTRNASDGVNLVVSALTFEPADTLVSTDQEHPAVLLPLSAARRRSGAMLRLMPLSGSDEELLESLSQLVSKRHVALAVFSHVSCETGRRLPVREMCTICRSHGVISLVDAAQSVGQFPVDATEIGCDFMTGNGHKWLCGPKGTGFLYVSDRALDLASPIFIGDGSIEPHFRREEFSGESPGEDWQWAPSAARFEFGTRNWHTFGALSDAIDEWVAVGWERIEAHCEAMTARVKAEIEARDGLRLHSPSEWRESSSLVTFAVQGWQGEVLADRLWQHYNVIQRRVQSPNGIRVSIAAYTSHEDIDRLFVALDDLRA